MTIRINPYVSPSEVTGEQLPSPTSRGALRKRLWAWRIVFLVNLPVPVWFGVDATAPGTRIGMLLGVVPLWLLGEALCRRTEKGSAPLVAGGVLTGIAQFFPIMQLLAGMLAFTFGMSIGILSPVQDDTHVPHMIFSIAGSTYMTVATGGLLMALALCLGIVLQAFTPRRWWPGFLRDEAVTVGDTDAVDQQ